MKHSTGKRTKAEQSRFDKMKEMGVCMACYQNGQRNIDHSTGEEIPYHIEIHHLLSGNKRIGHMATVSLCVWHHRGMAFDWSICEFRTIKMMNEIYGPSLANGSKPFRKRFGTDKELLDFQNAFLGESDVA